MGAGTAPRSRKPFLISAEANALLASRFMRATISFGVPLGAIRPNQELTSKPGRPASSTVGTSGMEGERSLVVTASARSLPDFTCGNEEGLYANRHCTLPARRSVTAGALPL